MLSLNAQHNMEAQPAGKIGDLLGQELQAER